MIPRIAAALAVLALAGCGTTATPAGPAVPAKKTSRPAGPQGYQVSSALQSSLWHQLNRKLRKDDPGTQVKDVQCVEEGRQHAECVADFSDGTSESLSVVISADGGAYVTK
jgi:hypothetical protein